MISKAVSLLNAPTQDLFILEQEYPNVYVSVWLVCSTKLPSERVTATQPLNGLPHLIVKGFFFLSHFYVHYQTLRYTKSKLDEKLFAVAPAEEVLHLYCLLSANLIYMSK